METHRTSLATQHPRQFIDEHSQALESDYALAAVLCRRGRVRGMLNDDAGALADFNRAIELDPDGVESYLLRGLQKDIRGDHTGAAVDYAKVQELIARLTVEQSLHTACEQ